MKEHLLQFLSYNDWANKETLKAILQLPEPSDAIYLFSHLVYAQDKWYNRITPGKPDEQCPQFGPSFPLDTLEAEWKRSVGNWLQLVERSSEDELNKDLIFFRSTDKKKMAVPIKDLVFQLCCHSVHHRAQLNKMISAQGLKVPLTDYIYTKLREVEAE
ncbi:MAG TPA: DinB family protein [Flavipsychrobacter sp.]|nr:DinB family protein [Flavipsychrobacter sp.]